MTDGYAYFLDIDGTLLGFASRPTGVRVAAGLRAALTQLRRRAGGAVALVSGRPLTDIDRLFGGRAGIAAGLHGLEYRRPDGRLIRHAVAPQRLDAARRRLQAFAARHPRTVLEDKDITLALHYRRAPELAGAAGRVMRAARAAAGHGFVLQRGKSVIELKPARGDKGAVIRVLLRTPPFRGRCPVFLGDDTTDEPGFAAVTAAGGLAVKVGPGPTVAAWRVAGATAVRRWLRSGTPLPALAPVRATRRRSS